MSSRDVDQNNPGSEALRILIIECVPTVVSVWVLSIIKL